MIRETRLSPEMIDALEMAIREAVQERIDTDPDVADCYLRIIPGRWMVQVMYIEESNLTAPNRDVALLNLMYDLKDSAYLLDISTKPGCNALKSENFS